MRLSVRGLRVVLLMLVCLLTLLLLISPFVFRRGSEIDPPHADSLPQATEDPLKRSEALRQHVRDACRALDFSETKTQKVTLSHLLYDDTHQVIYCFIPKVAYTSWKRVFLKTTGRLGPGKDINSLNRGRVHSIGLPRLASSENPEEKLKTYRKFMFVRHPFERVLSAFRDKLERKDELGDFRKTVGKQIEKKYRLPVCGLHGVPVMLVCLVPLLLVISLLIIFGEQGEIGRHPDRAPAHADSLSQATVDPLTRSEALRQHVRNACRVLDFSEAKMQKVTLSHLLYDDTYKVIYCYIPKVACTSWKRVFLKMTGMVPPERDITTLTRSEVHSIGLPKLASSKNPEEKLKTYKKFMFVRRPFERVLSAFRDKMERKDELWDFHKIIGTKIEMKYRGTTAAGGHNITFPEFIRYISEPGPGTTEQQNEHWLPMHEVCDPCSVEYDFIGTKEHLEEDAEYVLEWLGVTELVGGFPSITGSRPVNASKHTSRYLKQLTRTEVLAFYAKFLPDYLLFDYEFL